MQKTPIQKKGTTSGLIVYVGTLLTSSLVLGTVNLLQFLLYAGLTLFAAIPVWYFSMVGTRLYARHRFMIIPFPILTPAILFGVVYFSALLTKGLNESAVLIVPFLYSIPASIIAWIVVIVLAERYRRSVSAGAPSVPQSTLPPTPPQV